MPLLEEIEERVSRRADQSIELVLERLLNKSPAGDRDRCSQQCALVLYVYAKKNLHHFNKKNRDYFPGDFSHREGDRYLDRLNYLTSETEKRRAAYYDTQCTCGTCPPKKCRDLKGSSRKA